MVQRRFGVGNQKENETQCKKSSFLHLSGKPFCYIQDSSALGVISLAEKRSNSLTDINVFLESLTIAIQ